MTTTVDFSKQIYIYDDRSKLDYFLKVQKVMFQDDDIYWCECEIMCGEYAGQKEKIIVEKKTCKGRSSGYSYWYATDDDKWILKEIKKR